MNIIPQSCPLISHLLSLPSSALELPNPALLQQIKHLDNFSQATALPFSMMAVFPSQTISNCTLTGRTPLASGDFTKMASPAPKHPAVRNLIRTVRAVSPQGSDPPILLDSLEMFSIIKSLLRCPSWFHKLINFAKPSPAIKNPQTSNRYFILVSKTPQTSPHPIQQPNIPATPFT